MESHPDPDKSESKRFYDFLAKMTRKPEIRTGGSGDKVLDDL